MENTSSTDLNSKVSEITTLLDTLEEIMASYTSASNAEKKNIEERFATTKQKAIDLQTEINDLLSEMKLEQPVMDLLKQKYPKYVNSLEDLHVLNTKNIRVSNNKNNKKNNAAVAPAANNSPKNNTAAANNTSKNNSVAANNTKNNSVAANNNTKNNSAPANNTSKNNSVAANNNTKNNSAPANQTPTVGGRRKSRRLSKKRSKRTRRGVRR